MNLEFVASAPSRDLNHRNQTFDGIRTFGSASSLGSSITPRTRQDLWRLGPRHG